MPKLRVQEVATERGFSISKLQRDAGVQMTTARRYWYSTRDGKQHGEPIREIDLGVLRQIADVLGVGIKDLIEDESLALYGAAA